MPRAVAAVRSHEKRRRVRPKVKDNRRNRAAAEVVRAVASTGAEVEVLRRNRKHQSRTRHHPIDTQPRRHMTGSRRSAHRSISTAMMSTTRDANRSRRRANNAVLPGTSAPAFSDNAAMTQTTGSRQRATKMATSQGELANLFIFIHLE